MTYFVNMRAGPYGALCTPFVLTGDALPDPPQVTTVIWEAVPYLVKNRDVFLGTHGFNVPYADGLRCLQRLEAVLAPDPAAEAFMGVLWPGDWAIQAVNYPFEDSISSHAGALLGDFCNRWLKSARSISMVSHSLGARVILGAIKASNRRIRHACITAGAVNSAALREEYAAAAQNCDDIRTLSSMQDMVLRLAYPPGDFLADALDPDHPQFEPAMGRGGPTAPFGANIHPTEIPDAPPYDHGDYFPPGKLPEPLPPAPPGGPDWRNAARFMADALRGRQPSWP